jgi:hypothetical protein
MEEFKSMGRPQPFARTAAILLCLAVLSGGCIPVLNPTEAAVGPNGETVTPTLNATQRAIALMLTETRAAPTITLTQIVTPTETPTPTATTPPQGSSARPVVIGTRVTAGGAALTVLAMKTVNTLGKGKAVDGSTFLDLEVLIENASGSDAGDTSSAAMDYTPLYFRLQDPTGATYQPENQAVWPALQSGTLQPGEWVRGHVTFSVPADQTKWRLSYSPQVAPNRSVEIWVDLSQPAVQASLPTTGPVSAKQPLPGAGQRVEMEGIALTVESVKSSQQVDLTRASAGNVLVILNVTIENAARVKTPYNPEYFTVKDPDGYEYPAIIIPAETLLQAGSLGKSQKVSGQVIFEVPANANRLVVEYQPQVLMENYPLIRIQISLSA